MTRRPHRPAAPVDLTHVHKGLHLRYGRVHRPRTTTRPFSSLKPSTSRFHLQSNTAINIQHFPALTPVKANAHPNSQTTTRAICSKQPVLASDMATDNTPQRRKMFDGERERELWLPGDGPGDSDLDLVKSSVDRVGGHPTWRIYANDIPGGIVEGGQKPPTRVYLDDKACFDIIQSRAFSGHSKGRNWPFDFTQHGGIRATRPNRGRPALLSDGITIGTCTKPSGTYFFWGADGDPSKKKKHRATSANLDDVEIESPRSPGPMDILRQDDANYAAAFAAVGDDDAMAIDDGVEGGELLLTVILPSNRWSRGISFNPIIICTSMPRERQKSL